MKVSSRKLTAPERERSGLFARWVAAATTDLGRTASARGFTRAQAERGAIFLARKKDAAFATTRTRTVR